jgi:two-component system NtrC family response regulator
VGGTRAVSVDVRIIAATNKHLKSEIEAGRFREDLFYRLNVLYLNLPPLRDRQEDIGILVDYFIRKYAQERQTPIPVIGINREVERLLYDYNWPGNVRELENVIERAMIMCAGREIQVGDLPKHFKNQVYNTLHMDGIPVNAKLNETLAMVEMALITRALKLSDNVQTRAAELLGIGKSGLNQKIKKYKLDVNTNKD